MKTNIKATITCLYISKTTIIVNKCEDNINNFYFQQTVLLFLSFFYFIPKFLLLFSSFFSLTFFILILLYLSRTCIIFCQHIWGELSFLFWTFLSGTFFRCGGACAPSAPPLLRMCLIFAGYMYMYIVFSKNIIHWLTLVIL